MLTMPNHSPFLCAFFPLIETGLICTYVGGGEGKGEYPLEVSSYKLKYITAAVIHVLMQKP